MATMVCRQGLESQLMERRALRLKLSPTVPHFCQPPLELTIKSCFFDSKVDEVEEKCCDEDVVSKKGDSAHKHGSGGWSFLEALSIGPQSSKETEKESAYVHPLVKRSFSSLSAKSLELCTENLGNETGSDILEDSIFSLSPSGSESGNPPTRKQHQSRQLWGAKKEIPRNFPPPLTTISGSESLQVRPHREDGRLVIKAVKAPSSGTLFQAERSNGRLRLCVVRDSTPNFDYGEETTEKESEVNEEEKFENDSNSCEAPEDEHRDDEDEEEEEEGGGEGFSAYMEDDIDEKRTDIGVEMGMNSFQRPGRGRCKEGEHKNKRLLNWEPLWVATS